MKLQNLIRILMGIVCIGLLPRAQAVSPPPPGGYPNFTTAAGDHALQALTLGLGNTALGTFSSFSVTTGGFNTAVGAGALDLNTADSNTATGAAALLFNTTGTENTANGTAALEFNDTASDNTANGAFALFSHVSGNGNTANGWHALFSDTSGQVNTAIGAGALASDDNGFNGSFNTAVGASALFSNNAGDNTAIGAGALQGNTSGNENLAIGVSALVTNQTGNRNIALGSFAGSGLMTGSDNIYIGYNLGATAGESNACYIKSIFGQTNNLGSAVFIDANNKLGTLTSSKRFKEDIQPMDKASDALFALKPVSFHYKKQIDPAGKSQFGLVAEDVEKVNPDLVVRDKEGKAYSVRYDQVNAMLLNEFLKEHNEVQSLEAQLAPQQQEFGSKLSQQDKHIESLSAGLQKGSAQLEMSRRAPEMAANNQ